MGMPLSIAVQLWPTPQASDGRRAGLSREAIEKAWIKSTQRKRGPCSILGYAALGFHRRGFSDATPPASGYPNPEWVEWLMGFPAGWTSLDLEPLETPLSPPSPSTSAAD